ncbi:MAG: parallel beta-helix domain-containing protein [Stenotrophomonas sp.]
MQCSILVGTIGAVALVLSGCQKAPEAPVPAPADAGFARVLQEKLLDARPGDVIEVPEGTFRFDRSLSLRVDNVTLRGKGMDKSILSFKGQKAGAEGLLVNANGFTLENLAIEDSKGDGFKISQCENVTVRGVRVEWTGGPKTSNGGYGLYPVLCRNVLIEDSVAIGASDSGIYVGQSRDVIVRNNRAERNVAGIEIENTINADVHDNLATGNTGGILVFNMPALTQQGDAIRVFRNKVVENNHDNFGAKGTPVASVPAGSGVVINSNDNIEIFDNDIAGNRTANIIVSSVYSTGYKDDKASGAFDPYPGAHPRAWQPPVRWRRFTRPHGLQGAEGGDVRPHRQLPGRAVRRLRQSAPRRRPADLPARRLRRAQRRRPRRLQEPEQGRQALRLHVAVAAGGRPEAWLRGCACRCIGPLLALAALLLAGCACAAAPEPVRFFADGQPERLAEWNVLYVADGRLRLNARVLPYDLDTALFTDYAHKLRTVWMPAGTRRALPAGRGAGFPGRHHHQQDVLLPAWR